MAGEAEKQDKPKMSQWETGIISGLRSRLNAANTADTVYAIIDEIGKLKQQELGSKAYNDELEKLYQEANDKWNDLYRGKQPRASSTAAIVDAVKTRFV